MTLNQVAAVMELLKTMVDPVDDRARLHGDAIYFRRRSKFHDNGYSPVIKTGQTNLLLGLYSHGSARRVVTYTYLLCKQYRNRPQDSP